MHLQEHVHAQGPGQVGQFPEARIVQGGGDEEDAVRPQHARLQHLVGVDGEVLAQHRQAGRLAGAHQVRIRPLEEVHVGEHGEAGGPGLGVGAGDGLGVEVGAQHALAGGGLLDLGDDCRLAPLDAGLQGRSETAHRRRLGQARAQLSLGQAGAPLGHLLGLAREDAAQDVRGTAHANDPARDWVKATSRSSFSRARPESMASAARSMPSGKVSARPAV